MEELGEDPEALLAVVNDPAAFARKVASSDAVKRKVIGKLRPVLEPHLSVAKLRWEDVEAALELVDTVDELHAAISDPQGFLERIIQGVGPIAKRVAIEQLRPLLEPHLQQVSLEWADVARALELVDTVQELRAAASDPDGFLKRVVDGVGPVAKRIAIAKLKPLLMPHLSKLSLEWTDVALALELVDSVDELRAAMQAPEAFITRVMDSVGPVAKRLVIGKLKPLLVPHLSKLSLEWADVVTALELVDTVQELRAAASDPDGFLTRAMDGVGPVAKRLVIGKLRPLLLPLLPNLSLEWADVKSVLALVDSVGELRAALGDPRGFLQRVIDGVGPLAKRIAIQRLKPLLMPHLSKLSLGWADVMMALELVDSVDELRGAMSDPQGFLTRGMEGAGPVAKRLVIGKLRPLLVPLLPKLSLEWADVATALELVDTVQELRAALSDPEGFLTRAMDGVGPVAKRLAVAKLKPLLFPHLSKVSLQWENVEAAVELMDTLEEIRSAASDPQSFLQHIAESAVLEIGSVAKIRAPLSIPSVNPSVFLTRVKRGTEASAIRVVAQVNQWEHECFDADEPTGKLTGANPRDIWASLQSMRGEADVALHGEEMGFDEFQRLINVAVART